MVQEMILKLLFYSLASSIAKKTNKKRFMFL